MPATIKAKCTTFDALLWGLYSGRIEMYTVTLHTAYHFTWVLSCCTSQQATPTLGNWWHYSIKPNPNSQNYNSLNMNSSSQSFVMLLQMHTLEVPDNKLSLLFDSTTPRCTHIYSSSKEHTFDNEPLFLCLILILPSSPTQRKIPSHSPPAQNSGTGPGHHRFRAPGPAQGRTTGAHSPIHLPDPHTN